MAVATCLYDDCPQHVFRLVERFVRRSADDDINSLDFSRHLAILLQTLKGQENDAVHFVHQQFDVELRDLYRIGFKQPRAG